MLKQLTFFVQDTIRGSQELFKKLMSSGGSKDRYPGMASSSSSEKVRINLAGVSPRSAGLESSVSFMAENFFLKFGTMQAEVVCLLPHSGQEFIVALTFSSPSADAIG